MSASLKILLFVVLYAIPLAFSSIFFIRLQLTIMPEQQDWKCSPDPIHEIRMTGSPLPYSSSMCRQGNTGEEHVNWTNLILDFFIHLVVWSGIFYIMMKLLNNRGNKWLKRLTIAGSILLWSWTIFLIWLFPDFWDDMPGWFEHYKIVDWSIHFFNG